MAGDHSLSICNAEDLLKIAQTIISVVVPILCLYDVAIMRFNGCVFAIWTALCTLVSLAVYFHSLRNSAQTYKLTVVIVLDIASLLLWLAACVSLGTVYSILMTWDENQVFDPEFSDWKEVETYCAGVIDCLRRLEFMARDADETFGMVLVVALGLSFIQVLLYCSSLSLLTKSGHRDAGMGHSAKSSIGSIDNIEQGKTE